MNTRQVVAAEQIMYRKPIAIVKEYLDFAMGMQPDSDIHVTPLYPHGWEAQVAANGKVWTLGCRDGYIHLLDVGECRGFLPNGRMIVYSDGENMSELERFFLETETHEDAYNSPLTCENFYCNNPMCNCVSCNRF